MTTTMEGPTFFQSRILEEEQKVLSPRRGVIYARYSSDMQDTNDSIEVQLAECNKYAMANNIIVVREPFVDRAETGTSTENRDSYQKLLILAQGHDRDFDVILTFHTSRWGRGIQSEIDEYLLEKNGIQIIAVSQPFTADNAVESIFMKGVLRKIDAYYSLQASKYTHAYQSSNAQNGFKNGGPAADGYVLDHIPTGKKSKRGGERMKSKLLLDEKPGEFDVTTQPRCRVVEYAFLNAYKGMGIRRLSKEIYRLGWRSRYSNQPISSGTIRNWLTNPIYTGYMVWNRVKFFRRNGHRSYKPNPISKWICSKEPSHQAIVSKEVFEKVAIRFMRRNGRQKGNSSTNPPVQISTPDNRGKFLLSGLLFCGKCQASYVAARNLHRNKRTQIYFVCNTKWRQGKERCNNANINMAVAEGAVMDGLLNVLLSEGEIKKFVEGFNEFVAGMGGHAEQENSRIQPEKEKIEQEMANIKRAILQGVDSRSFAEELRERQSRLDDLENQRQTLATLKDQEKLSFDPTKLQIWIENIRNMLLSSDYATRREMVVKFVKRIEVYPDKTGELKWDPSAILNLVDGQRVPKTLMMVMKNLAGARPESVTIADPKMMVTKNGCGRWI